MRQDFNFTKNLEEVRFRNAHKTKYFFLSFCFLPPRKICATILSRVHLCNDFSQNIQKRDVQLEIQETDLTLEKLGDNVDIGYSSVIQVICKGKAITWGIPIYLKLLSWLAT